VLVTLVVRLLPDRLANGEFVGEVEHVGDGEHAYVHGLTELLGFAQRAAGADPAAPPGSEERPPDR
jgi:hypothetical protein